MFNFTLANIGVETEKPQLGEQQVEALDAMKEFLKNKNKRAFSLIGAAGTGKSFLMRTLIEYMDLQWNMLCVLQLTKPNWYFQDLPIETL